MSKPAAYTVQLQQKANGVLQMRLMVPGHNVIIMHPKELREVAGGIEAMFDQASASTPARSHVEILDECVQSLQRVVSDALDKVQKLMTSNFELAQRVRALEKSSAAQHLTACASTMPAEGCGCQTATECGAIRQ